MKYLRSFTVLFAAMWAGGCMMQSQTPPNEMGPSGFGLALTITASPDILPKDGSSQSTIHLNYRDGVTNAPLPGRRITVAASGGTLSAGEVVTDSAGNASLTLTAPSINVSGSTITVTALPVGDNINNAVAQLVRVGLLGPEVPTASFTYLPAAPASGSAVTFTSTSTLAGSACDSACGYNWDFGDGTSGTGQIVQKTYASGGVKSVTLTVFGPGGASNSTTVPIVVTGASGGSGGSGGGGSITAAFVVTTQNPTAGSPTAFDASTSVGANNYHWDFGDGNQSAGIGSSLPTAQNVYTNPGTYNVTLTITGNSGITASVTQPVTIN
jgi:PKD repeat protein